MAGLRSLKQLSKRFAQDETGVVTLEFMIVFPVFLLFFLMTYESGMISTRHVMLERGLDIAVREIRIGIMTDPDRDTLRQRICEEALIIPNCMSELEIELLQRDPMNWVAVPSNVRCIDRGKVDQEEVTVDGTGNNFLMFVRACARFDPVLPTTGLGKIIVENNSGDAAGGSYALVSIAAFVVEPFRVASN